MSKRPGDPGYAGGWCIHYRTPSHHDTCEVGVPYSKWDGTKFGVRPCFLDSKTGESKPDAIPCEHLRRPTPEEIAAHEQWCVERWNKTALALEDVAPYRKQGGAHIIDCPVCKTGKLHFTIARSNGHCHARCSTGGCVSWME